jgi:Holliday junction resolvase RusA-like endonuclease
MTQISFTVPGAPIGKGRPRFAKRGEHVRVYTDEKTVNFENLVKLFASQAMAGLTPFKRPVALSMVIVMQIPASWSKKRQDLALRGLIGATTKPDVSNVLKAIEDGMNGIVYDDDKQIVGGGFSKQYGLIPRVEVRVQEYEKEAA